MKKIMLMSLLSLATFAAFSQDKQPVQCKGTTVKNVRCANMVKDGEYCHYHNPETSRCGVKTSKGAPCKNIVKSKDAVCNKHIGKEKMQPVSAQ